MGRVRVAGFSISIDGFGAGPGQSLEQPLGQRGMELHQWVLGTRTFRAMLGQEGGIDNGADAEFAAAAMQGIGAWILGRNMFGPVRGPWPDEAWKGWWGEEPPYRVRVFVLTHHARAPVTMKGGTVFHFVTEGIEDALQRARQAAGGQDVRIGGGAATVRQYLQAGAIDELHIAIAPVLLGRGEALFAGLDLPAMGYRVARRAATELATHVVLTREAPPR